MSKFIEFLDNDNLNPISINVDRIEIIEPINDSVVKIETSDKIININGSYEDILKRLAKF